MFKALHGFDGILMVVEGGQTEIIFAIFAKASSRGSDYLCIL